jgi:branched-chain amino acid transport system ATP-binding protein
LILQVKNINFSFSPEKQILQDISLSLDEKNVYALMGSNGAGKTTLFNIISGYIKPQEGTIYFGETNITNQQPYKINRLGIGRTFQNLRLIGNLTVKENIILTMHYNPTDNWIKAMLPESVYKKTNLKLCKKADEIIEQFFISDVKNSLAAEISYGQQKLLSLACCVANGAMLFLLDEAVAGIQPEYRNKIAMLIKHLKEQGKTIFLIEHNTDFIADVADKIFFLHNGEISSFENMETLRKDKYVMEAYI